MHCTTAEGTTCSLIMITTGKRQNSYTYHLPDYQWSDFVLHGNLCAWGKRVQFIFELPSYNLVPQISWSKAVPQRSVKHLIC